MTLSNDSSGYSSMNLRSPPIPALLIKISMVPNFSCVFLTNCSTDALSVTSSTSARASPPSCSMAPQVFSPPYSSRSAMMTVAPCLASSIEVALPIPDPPPVTIAILFFISICCLIYILWQYQDAYLVHYNALSYYYK